MIKEMALRLISEEYDKAVAKFGPFRSPHEGWAILKEEADELWDDVKANVDGKEEAIQVGAMAMRFLTDCCKHGEDNV